MTSIIQALTFLIDAFVGLFILALILRTILYAFGATARDAMSVFIINITNPVLMPLYRFIPRAPRIDFAAISVMIVLEILKWVIILALHGTGFSVLSILLLSIKSLIRLVLFIFFVAILVQVILSWVALLTQNPMHNNPISYFLYQLTEPLLRPVRKMLPDMGGVDISPMLVMILLYAGIILVSA